VQLDTLPEAAQLLSALDQIFRLYVRGFALPGQQHDGSSVHLVGQKLPFGSFLLDGTAKRVLVYVSTTTEAYVCCFQHSVIQGPYMSWDGFLRFSFDFRIAKLPPAV
jgi:hypothetical protein